MSKISEISFAWITGNCSQCQKCSGVCVCISSALSLYFSDTTIQRCYIYVFIEIKPYIIRIFLKFDIKLSKILNENTHENETPTYIIRNFKVIISFYFGHD